MKSFGIEHLNLPAKRRFVASSLSLFVTFGSANAQKALTLEGLVVCCAECWAEADRTKVEYGTAENLLKAKSCVEGGDPTLLAVRKGDTFKLYQLGQGKFKMPGKNWLEFVGKRVKVTGELRKKDDADVIRVDALEVTGRSLAEQEAANAIRREIELVLKDLSGTEQRLSSLRGRIVVLNFWATYCIPCRKEMPDLTAIQNEYAALGVQVIGASADEEESRAEVLKFVKETRINFPIWIGANASDMVRFGLGGALPGTVIIGKDGKIARVISGVINPSDVKKQLDLMLTTSAVETTGEPIHRPAQVATAKKSSGAVSSVPS
jgi:thiol-disulfide isomerase/thioredoxin